MDNYNNKLVNILQSTVVFKCKNKVIKTGTVKLFNIKQYFIKFYIEMSNTKETKVLELPYPFEINVGNDGDLSFNYSLSCLRGMIPALANSFINKAASKTDKVHKFYDNVISIIPIKNKGTSI